MNNQSNIERVVMRRVHRIHRLRPLVSGSALASSLLLLALWGIGREVWVAMVFANMPRAGLLALGSFYLAAFENTRLIVQVLALVCGASLLYLARATAQALSSTFIPARA